MAPTENSEPFPSLSPSNTADNGPAPFRPSTEAPVQRGRAGSTASSIGRASRTRGASLVQTFVNSNPPLGMWQATGEVGAKIPTLPEIKHGAFADEGWSHEGQMERRGANPHEIHRRRIARTSSASTRTRNSTLSTATPGTILEGREASFFPHSNPVVEETSAAERGDEKDASDPTRKSSDMVETTEHPESTSSTTKDYIPGPDETGTYPNGYRFPKKHTWTQSVAIGSKAFFRFACTPFGFIITIYGLNVVAWGAMIFFVLLNAAPAMCHPSCNADSSPRKKWIEIDSQVLNGLFCVTGFGLAPWRFRDLYFLMRWRVLKEEKYARKLAGINRSWFRLAGSQHLPDDMGPPPVYSKKNPQLPESPPPYTEEEIAVMEANPAIPLPATSMPDPPLTGVRAQPTRTWLIDVVVWMYVLNTVFQVVLASFMWVYNRFTRPSWATGFFISIGCVVAICAGIVVFIEGSKVKKVEGIPVKEYDVFETIEEAQARREKKEAKKHHHDKEEKGDEFVLKRVETRKLKGHHWFTRH